MDANPDRPCVGNKKLQCLQYVIKVSAHTMPIILMGSAVMELMLPCHGRLSHRYSAPQAHNKTGGDLVQLDVEPTGGTQRSRVYY